MNTELKEWYEAFKRTETQPMSSEMTRVFMQLTMAELQGLPEIEELKEEFIYKLIDGRAAYMGLALNFFVKALIAILSSTPAEAVMYLTALRVKQLEDGAMATMGSIAHMFPTGFPVSLEGLWDKQKTSQGNMLDNVKW